MAGDSLRETVSNLTESLSSYLEVGRVTATATAAAIASSVDSNLPTATLAAAAVSNEVSVPTIPALLMPLSDYYQRSTAAAAPSTEAGTNLVGVLSGVGSQLQASSMPLASVDTLKGK